MIDGVVNGVGAGAKVTAAGLYKYVDQKGVDGAVNGLGVGTSLSGRALRKLQSGQVQQYAAWLFAGAAMFVLYVALNA